MTGPKQSRRPRLIGLLLTAMVAVIGLSSGHAAAQQDGLIVSSSTTYTPEPNQGEIEVEASYSLTNVTPDQTAANGSVESYYFHNWSVTVPVTVVDLTAVSSGQPLTTSFAPIQDSEHVVFAVIELPFDLRYEETVTLDIAYTIPGSQPRGDLFEARVNDSYISFPIWTAGDSGEADVRVIVPTGFTVEVQGDEDDLVLATEAGGQRVLEAIDLESPREFFAHIYGRNDDGLLVETVMIDDANATIRAWPDDPAWVDFVVDAIEDDVPVMEDLIGIEWPAGDIEIIESVTPYLRGYGGWFDAQSGEIQVGPRLERSPILHELAHAWFHSGLIQDRWIVEGLAEEYASQTIFATGGERPEPERPDLDDQVRVPLNSWESPFAFAVDEAVAYESYHYNAAWWVISELTTEVGIEAMSDVLVSLDAGVSAFAREPRDRSDMTEATWRQFLDLVERRAGSADAASLFQTYVLDDADVTVLTTRSEAHDRYDALVERARPWLAPEGLRAELAHWSFDAAGQLLDAADVVLDTRDKVDGHAAELGVTFADSRGRRRFESATSGRNLETAAQVLADRVAELRRLEQARADAQRAAAVLGVEVDFVPGEFNDAIRAVDLLNRQLAELDTARLDAELAARSVGVTMPPWPVSAGTVNFEAEHALIDERLNTVAAIVAADEAVASKRSLSQRVGLWRIDVEPHVADARTAFEADDRAAALDASSQALTLIADASDLGTTRILWTTAAAAALVVLVTGLTIYTRRRKVRRPK